MKPDLPNTPNQKDAQRQFMVRPPASLSKSPSGNRPPDSTPGHGHDTPTKPLGWCLVAILPCPRCMEVLSRMQGMGLRVDVLDLAEIGILPPETQDHIWEVLNDPRTMDLPLLVRDGQVTKVPIEFERDLIE